MKELVKNFNNYTFINKGLLNAMDVPESKLEGKTMKVSKNGKNTSLLFTSNNYQLTIEVEKKKDKNIINNRDNYILNKIKNDEGYDLKLNNTSYNLLIYNDDNYIYFNLFEKNEILFYSNKYDLKSITQLLKLSPNNYNDLNKIKILFNEAYNNDKISLTINNNNINAIIKILYKNNNDYEEIICKIELNKDNLGINEKTEFLLKNLEKLNKNKNISFIKENLLIIENNLKHLQNSIKNILNENKVLKEEKEKEKNELKSKENKEYKSLNYVKHIDNIEINTNKAKISFENKETQTIINQYNEIIENKENNKTYEKIMEKEKNEYKNIISNNDNKNQINELNRDNDNINEKVHEIKEKENYEGKDKIDNNIMKEDNNKDDNKNRNEEIGIKNHKKYKEYNIDELKKRKKNLEILFKDLCKNIIGNNEMNDLNINELNS